MARLIRHEGTGPIEVKPQDQSVWICACGLTQNQPFCDGSHKIAKQNDQPGKVCVYDKARKAVIDIQEDL